MRKYTYTLENWGIVIYEDRYYLCDGAKKWRELNDAEKKSNQVCVANGYDHAARICVLLNGEYAPTR